MHQREQFSGVRAIRGPEKGRGGLGFEVDKIRLGDKKGGSTSHDPRCKRR